MKTIIKNTLCFGLVLTLLAQPATAYAKHRPSTGEKIAAAVITTAAAVAIGSAIYEEPVFYAQPIVTVPVYKQPVHYYYPPKHVRPVIIHRPVHRRPPPPRWHEPPPKRHGRKHEKHRRRR